MGGFDEYSIALRGRDAISRLIENSINRLRPEPKIGEVYDFDKTTNIAYIVFPGDTQSLKATYSREHTIRRKKLDLPGGTAQGDLVRVAGRLGNYYVIGVLEDPSFSYKPIVDVYEADATWTKRPGLARVHYRIQGSGGSGGGADTTGAGQACVGGGGGAGALAEGWIEADDLNDTEPVEVGVGAVGTAGAAGSSGEQSSFAGRVALGGNGGGMSAVSAGNTTAASGTAGSATGGDINLNGGRGSVGRIVGGLVTQASRGGSSHFHMGGQEVAVSTGGNGQTGVRGSGGSGALNNASQATARTGGTGGDGIIVVTSYFR